MKREWTPIVAGLAGLLLFTGCDAATAPAGAQPPTTQPAMSDTPTPDFEPIRKTDAQWRKELTPEQYRVAREHGTERPFTSELLKEKRPGTFYAVGGTVPLFRSETKFESGTGWPSFYDVVDPSHVTLIEDDSFGMTRTEVRCAQTGHHLGHVFNDGPRPTGLRYCINGQALRFEPDGPTDK